MRLNISLCILLALLCCLPVLGQSFPVNPYSRGAASTAPVWEGQSPGIVQPTGAPTFAPESFGVNDLTVVSLTSFAFGPFNSGVTYAWSDGVFITSADGLMQADLQVPNGTVLVRIEMEACDLSSVGGVTLSLLQFPLTPGFIEYIGAVTTGSAETPGCGVFSLDLPLPHHVVDTTNNSYFVDVVTGTTPDTRLRSARVSYRRQISPAPATATFLDVPTTHPLHQYVEALQSSGITAGCGDGTNFCPNDPLTRGQMAVFLAKALGLHWAP